MKKFIIAVMLSLLAFTAVAKKAEPKEHPGIEVLRSVLKDPASLIVYKTNITQSGVCGTYNAKNSYGGYVGVQLFYVDNVRGLQSEEVEHLTKVILNSDWGAETIPYGRLREIKWYESRVAEYQAKLDDLAHKETLSRKELKALGLKPLDIALSKSTESYGKTLMERKLLEAQAHALVNENAYNCLVTLSQ